MNDYLLVNFWQNKTSEERDQLFKQLDVIEKEMLAEEHKPIKAAALHIGRVDEMIFEEEDEELMPESLKKGSKKKGGVGARKRFERIFQREDDSSGFGEEEDFDDDEELTSYQR